MKSSFNVASVLFVLSLVSIRVAAFQDDVDPTAAQKKARAAGTVSKNGREGVTHFPTFLSCGHLILDPDSSVPAESSTKPNVRKLEELIAADPTKNLTVQNPLMALSVSSRARAAIFHQPPVRVLDPEIGGRMVWMYPMLSVRSPQNNYTAVDGHLELLSAFVDWIDSGTRGDTAARRTFQLVGPAGTGKSALSATVNAGLANIGRFDSRKLDWTFRLVGLREVFQGAEKEVLLDTYEVPFFQSPLMLLPEAFQKSILMNSDVREAAIRISGRDPQPDLRMNDQVKFLRNRVIEHYQREKGKPLTDSEIVMALSRHVEIIPWTQGKSNSSSVIDAQGTDIEWSGLLFTENPIVKAVFGAGHPMAYHLSGALPRLNGGVGTLDEWYRNRKELLDFLLGVQESRVMQRGGSITVPLVSALIAAANDESVDEASASGGAKAQVDRANMEPMRWSTHPWVIMKTMLGMKGQSMIEQRKLADDAGHEETHHIEPFVPVNLEELFVYSKQVGQPMLAPQRRYALRFKMGPGEYVDISPHALELMVYVISATRQVNDPEAALKAKIGREPPKVTNSAEFRDPVTRIKIMTGRLDISAAVAQELATLRLELKEGSKGISQRNASDVWLQELIKEARRLENGNTITPQMVIDTFQKLLRKGSIIAESNLLKTEWVQLLKLMAESFTVPGIRNDVMAAISEGEGDLTEVYDVICSEFQALEESDGKATHVTVAGGTQRAIDKERLDTVKTIYERNNHRPFRVSELVRLQGTYGVDGRATRHHLLLEAIEEMFAIHAMKMYSLTSLASAARTGSGTSATRVKLASFLSAMETRFGYSEVSAKSALEMVAQARELTDAR